MFMLVLLRQTSNSLCETCDFFKDVEIIVLKKLVLLVFFISRPPRLKTWAWFKKKS